MNEDKGKIFCDLGYMFAYGNRAGEFEQSDTAAIKFYTKAADLGDVDGQYELAKMLLNAKKPEEAVKWFLAAAKLGDRQSMYEISSMYGAGIGCTIDDAACESWFIKAGGLPHA